VISHAPAHWTAADVNLAKLRQIFKLIRSIKTFQDAAELTVARQITSFGSSWADALGRIETASFGG
jgi:hypothetical protein